MTLYSQNNSLRGIESSARAKINGTQKKSPEDWARIWFAKLAKFHNINNHDQWQFTSEQRRNRLSLFCGLGYSRALRLGSGQIFVF